jgi:poly(3-hydroxybutyrate) depolymerase
LTQTEARLRSNPEWAAREIEDVDHPERDDLAFATQLIDTLIEEWCADPARIYAVGESIGGTFSARLGCEMSERIAGIGAVHRSRWPRSSAIRPRPRQ